MNRILITTFALAAFARLGFAADEQQERKPPPRKKAAQAEQAQSAARSTNRSNRQVQARSQQRQQQTINKTNARDNSRPETVNRGIRSNNTGTVNRGNNQAQSFSRHLAPNTSTRPVVRNTTTRHFVRNVTGTHVSFESARQFNWRVRHDRVWWTSHFNRFVIYGGGYYFWNNGWWYPAYGYNPYYNNYPYDGPIFGYGYAAPGDVTTQVQQVLAQQGYYQGPIDGILGPGTRGAIAQWQADHGLVSTAAIDEQTLDSLGLA